MSTSYPYLELSRRVGEDYGTVLWLATLEEGVRAGTPAPLNNYWAAHALDRARERPQLYNAVLCAVILEMDRRCALLAREGGVT